jgi:hypothetical protein
MWQNWMLVEPWCIKNVAELDVGRTMVRKDLHGNGTLKHSRNSFLEMVEVKENISLCGCIDPKFLNFCSK